MPASQTQVKLRHGLFFLYVNINIILILYDMYVWAIRPNTMYRFCAEETAPTTSKTRKQSIKHVPHNRAKGV